MGRTRTFAPDEVVRAAREVFWDLGYADTAVPDLERATGLNRSSLYNSFGSKRGLFDAAVDSYLDEVVRPRLAPLRTADVAPDALETYLRGLREAMIEHPDRLAANGCLLLSAVGSSLGHDAALQQVITRYNADLRAAFEAGVAARRPDLPVDAARTLTTACTGLVLAAMSLVRADPAAAADMLDTALTLVAQAS